MKYRRIKSSNRTFDKYITQVDGALEILVDFVGFRRLVRDFVEVYCFEEPVLEKQSGVPFLTLFLNQVNGIAPVQEPKMLWGQPLPTKNVETPQEPRRNLPHKLPFRIVLELVKEARQKIEDKIMTPQIAIKRRQQEDAQRRELALKHIQDDFQRKKTEKEFRKANRLAEEQGKPLKSTLKNDVAEQLKELRRQKELLRKSEEE